MTLAYLDPVIVIGYSLTAAGLIICFVLMIRGAFRSRWRPGEKAERI
jgi:hypothetical protein